MTSFYDNWTDQSNYRLIWSILSKARSKGWVRLGQGGGGPGGWPGLAIHSAASIRRQRVNAIRGFRHRRWHLDKADVKINGELH